MLKPVAVLAAVFSSLFYGKFTFLRYLVLQSFGLLFDNRKLHKKIQATAFMVSFRTTNLHYLWREEILSASL